MRVKISIIICVLVVNLLFLSIGYSQSNVNVQAVVPQTENNKKQSLETSPNPSFKENKFQYYFEKYWAEQVSPEQAELEHSYEFYDKITSLGLMLVLMVITSLFTLIILRVAEYYKVCSKKRQ